MRIEDIFAEKNEESETQAMIENEKEMSNSELRKTC